MTEASRNGCACCGACCRSYIVNLCGYDVWLISTRQRLSPDQFVVPWPHPEPRNDGFRLDHQGPSYGLALDKRGRFHAKAPCIFLLELGGRSGRCGIYAHRPLACQAYPMQISSELVVSTYDNALCPPNSWPLAEGDRAAWRARLQRVSGHFDIYAEVVARWNARVAAAGPGASFSLHEYFSYLINVYDRLAVVAADFGLPAPDFRLEAPDPVMASDPSLSPLGSHPTETHRRGDDPPWPAYFTWARRVVNCFYPEIGPQRSPSDVA